jgi:putative nucleotidyltransferase with HDIG domain
MRLISTKTLKPKMVLATAVYNLKGQALIHEDVSITERMITRLKELGIQYVYIKDSLSNGIELENSFSSAVKQEAVQKIEETFTQVSKKKLSTNIMALEKSTKQFKSIIDTILTEVKMNSDILTVLTDVYAYDSYIFHHSFNVTLYTLSMGVELKLTQKQLEQLGLGAILHDIGKMLVPEEILLKPGRLTANEFAEIQKHSEYGFNILRQLQTVSLLVAHCAYQHHERLDGSGYPRGIKGNEIHPYAKIIAVADVFDAMTTNRVYKKAMLPHQALEILFAGADTLFDKDVVEAFRRSIAIYPTGMVVDLNDGRKGIVLKQNKNVTERPVLRVFYEDGEELNEPYELDLKNHLDKMIVGFDPDYENGTLKS